MRTTRYSALILLLLAGIANASAHDEPRLYNASPADQLLDAIAEDTVPDDPEMRRLLAGRAAFDAVIFGRPAVQTYLSKQETRVARFHEVLNDYLEGRR